MWRSKKCAELMLKAIHFPVSSIVSSVRSLPSPLEPVSLRAASSARSLATRVSPGNVRARSRAPDLLKENNHPRGLSSPKKVFARCLQGSVEVGSRCEHQRAHEDRAQGLGVVDLDASATAVRTFATSGRRPRLVIDDSEGSEVFRVLPFDRARFGIIVFRTTIASEEAAAGAIDGEATSSSMRNLGPLARVVSEEAVGHELAPEHYLQCHFVRRVLRRKETTIHRPDHAQLTVQPPFALPVHDPRCAWIRVQDHLGKVRLNLVYEHQLCSRERVRVRIAVVGSGHRWIPPGGQAGTRRLDRQQALDKPSLQFHQTVDASIEVRTCLSFESVAKLLTCRPEGTQVVVVVAVRFVFVSVDQIPHSFMRSRE